jgi:hypothetical protein
MTWSSTLHLNPKSNTGSIWPPGFTTALLTSPLSQSPAPFRERSLINTKISKHKQIPGGWQDNSTFQKPRCPNKLCQPTWAHCRVITRVASGQGENFQLAELPAQDPFVIRDTRPANSALGIHHQSRLSERMAWSMASGEYPLLHM